MGSDEIDKVIQKKMESGFTVSQKYSKFSLNQEDSMENAQLQLSSQDKLTPQPGVTGEVTQKSEEISVREEHTKLT